jgi:sec-independent protein translocase protein TatA
MVSPVLAFGVLSGSFPLATFGNFLGMDGLVVLILGLLIFGRKLPEVGKNLGKTIVEFKKGLAGGDKEETPSATDTQPVEEATKRLSNPTRVSVNSNLERTPVVRKTLPQTEEV